MIANLSNEECIEVLSNNHIGHLAYLVGSSPYIVPVTYYYDSETNSIISYSSEGHKISAMRDNNMVAFEVDAIKSVASWRTVLAHGAFEELQGIDAKHMLHEFSQGVKKLLGREKGNEPKFISDFSSKLYAEGTPVVFRIKILDIQGKQRTS